MLMRPLRGQSRFGTTQRQLRHTGRNRNGTNFGVTEEKHQNILKMITDGRCLKIQKVALFFTTWQMVRTCGIRAVLLLMRVSTRMIIEKEKEKEKETKGLEIKKNTSS